MSLTPCTILEPATLSPLVVDSPHSGRAYPADFAYACPLPLLRQAEDFRVDELIDGAADSGATVIAAAFPRSYIDVNRAENDIDAGILAAPWPAPLEPTRHTPQGLGLVRRLCRNGEPVYAAPLPVEEVQRRLERCYRPYHAALAAALAARHRRFGVACLIDAHSMPGGAGGRVDFVLGDRDGTSCDPALTRRVGDALRDMGYSVARNDPYRGMEIVRRHGAPSEGRHALQLEINRRLYMDEARLKKNANFTRVRDDLTRLFAFLAPRLAEIVPERWAAE